MATLQEHASLRKRPPAAAVFNTILGSDSPEAADLAAIALDPSRHPLHGFSMKWKTAVEDAPQGLGPTDFEDWLWGRQIPDGLAGFAVLPYQYQLRIIKGASSKKRHWYFLGQILRVEHLQHLVFSLRDMHGKERPLHFCTNERGRELTNSQCQEGYTVAVIDAVQDAFEAGDFETQPGIRLEDTRIIKKAGWDSKGHKTDCKFLKDPDLRALFLFKWDEAQVCDGFPLRVADDSC
ncbi:hypothetical protein E4U23_002085 [Claviceps purpurea]|nr:hypothetical protein E4U23_002085 [Claviceps purpurea]